MLGITCGWRYKHYWIFIPLLGTDSILVTASEDAWAKLFCYTLLHILLPCPQLFSLNCLLKLFLIKEICLNSHGNIFVGFLECILLYIARYNKRQGHNSLCTVMRPCVQIPSTHIKYNHGAGVGLGEKL